VYLAEIRKLLLIIKHVIFRTFEYSCRNVLLANPIFGSPQVSGIQLSRAEPATHHEVSESRHTKLSTPDHRSFGTDAVPHEKS